MRKFEYLLDEENHDESLEINDCTLVDAASIICREIQMLHGKLLRSDPEVAKYFKQIILAGINDPETPVFNEMIEPGNVEDLIILTCKKREGET